MNKLKLAVLGLGLAVVLAACSATATPYTSPVSTPAGSEQPTVMVADNPALGQILVDAKGMTLYTYAKDTANASNCSGACATAWPPLTVAAGMTPTAGAGVVGTLGTIQRADGSMQVTINGLPLYYYAGDANPGDTNGQGVQGVWYVVSQAASAAAAPQVTVMMADNPAVGQILVDGKGMTLYTYANDAANTSTCSGACATNWPPLTVAAGVTPTAGPGVTGTLGTIQREDGSWQVTIDGMPLYYYARDASPGDTNGEGIQNVWYVVSESGSASTAPGTTGLPTVMVTDNPVLGLILVDSKGMTLYTDANDAENTSTCSGACATTWPPLTVAAGVTPTAGPGVIGMLGVIQRPDGSYQVTIEGLPLYYYAQDAMPGDINGQGAQSVWYVVPQSAAQ